MDEIDALKTHLRKQFRTWRSGMDDAGYARRSAHLVARLHALPELHAARTLHVFAPMVARREPDLWPLLDALHGRGVRLVFPYVESLDPPTLRHRQYLGHRTLDPLGLPSADGPDVPLDELDAVLVPALAVDRRGMRLGYGKGFYDRMLARYRGFTVCPVFSELFVDALPSGPFDVPVACVVTEAATWRVAPNGEEAP